MPSDIQRKRQYRKIDRERRRRRRRNSSSSSRETERQTEREREKEKELMIENGIDKKEKGRTESKKVNGTEKEPMMPHELWE